MKGKLTKQPQKKNKEEKKLLFILEESIPFAQNERKKYVSDIALFYQTIFKSKLQHFIGLQLEELAQIGRTELGNNVIRANINCFRLVDTWMEKMTNEHVGNLESIRESFNEGEDFINKLHKKHGNI